MSDAASTFVHTLDIDTQRRLVAQVREVCRLSPLVRPRTPNGLDMRVMVTAAGPLGWVGDGEYRYSSTDSRGKPWPPIPDGWRERIIDAPMFSPLDKPGRVSITLRQAGPS